MSGPSVSAAIECSGIVKSFGGVHAIEGIDLTVPAGTVEALVGANGAGKSTFVGILTGRIAATEGTVRILGVEPEPGDPRASRAAGLMAIYQELTIVPGMTAEENVFLGMTPQSHGIVDGSEIRERYLALCERLKVRIPAKALARTLSVADRQVLEIMRALVADARVVLLDEPTAALAPAERAALLQLVRDLRAQGVTLVFISHNLEEVLAVADSVTVLRDGRVARRAPVREWTRDQVVHEMLGDRAKMLEEQWLPGAADPKHRKEPENNPGKTSGTASGNGRAKASGRTARNTPDRMPGKTARKAPGKPPAEPPKILLTARSVTLDGMIADIDVTVRPGEILGLGGLVGSGRTTLMRCLAGAEPRSTGRLEVHGREVPWPRSIVQGLANGVALIPEDRKHAGLVLGMTAMENITLAGFGGVARAGWLSARAMRRRTAELVEEFGFDPGRLDTPAGKLSGGNQQKLLLARWRYRLPRVLLADEPTRGVDVGAKTEILQALRRFADDGVAVIVASSELEEVSAVADRVLVLADGRAAAELAREGEAPISVESILAAAFDPGAPMTTKEAPRA